MSTSTDEDSDLEAEAKRRLTETEQQQKKRTEKNGRSSVNCVMDNTEHSSINNLQRTKIYSRRYAMLAMLEKLIFLILNL